MMYDHAFNGVLAVIYSVHISVIPIEPAWPHVLYCLRNTALSDKHTLVHFLYTEKRGVLT